MVRPALHPRRRRVMTAGDVVASRLRVTGLVQGVGFRPFVQRLATQHGLDGWVRNESGGVAIHIEGTPERLGKFMRELGSHAPPLTRIDSLDSASVSATGVAGFQITVSVVDHTQRLPISPDVAFCPDCERELFDAGNRRFRYPYITCTNCGPRFTVIESMPYDRERTSMRAFTQCAECLAEYEDPGSRRFHCESNSCPSCGPSLWLETSDGMRSNGVDSVLAECAHRLLNGEVLAIRGLGGFHLSVDANNDDAVRRLRERKRRDAKPLAVMVSTMADAERLGVVGPDERRLLSGPERPIVLLRRRAEARLAPAIAPDLDTIGVVVAYTPLHRLLLDTVARPLVMTSGNASDEPIATANDEAKARLGAIADAWLLHDRDIVSRYDDSVVRATDHGPIMIRRARGYAPLPVSLPIPATRPLLAVGPHLKSTFTLASDRHAYVSQHIGDLETLDTLESFEQTLGTYCRLFHVRPEVVVTDTHPEYLSTRMARDLDLPTILSVQHHHAHLAAVAAEHGVTEPVIGVIYDGTGYGDDGQVWGGEILVGDLYSYRRAAQLRYVPLPGGDLAARQLWRIVAGWCHQDPTATVLAAAIEHIDHKQRDVVSQQLRIGLNTPRASSMGRLFDAAAVILGLRDVARYEGQAAMQLETLAGSHHGNRLPYDVRNADGGRLELDPLPLLVALAERRAAGVDVAVLAASFHDSLAAATTQLVCTVADETGRSTVVLGGGVFQNARLVHHLVQQLRSASIDVLLPRMLGPNDGAISYGQAAVGAAWLEHGLTHHMETEGASCV